VYKSIFIPEACLGHWFRRGNGRKPAVELSAHI